MYQGKLFHFSNFIKKAVTLSMEFVLFEYIAQTRCLELLIHSNNFFRQPFTNLGELVPHKRFSQTSGVNNYLKICLYTVGFQDERKIDSICGVSCYGKSCFLWFFFPFMEFSVYGEKCKWNLLQIFRHYFICFSTVKSLQSSRLFRTILSN